MEETSELQVLEPQVEEHLNRTAVMSLLEDMHLEDMMASGVQVTLLTVFLSGAKMDMDMEDMMDL